MKLKETLNSDDFFTQRLLVTDEKRHTWDICRDLTRDKAVLHIGCVDFPFTVVESTLHYELKKTCSYLHGCDINGIEEFSKHCPGTYFHSLEYAIRRHLH